ncbi:hypothetical protein IWX49DRAFT_551967 [Phyllosticta citricarpa]
MASQKKDMRRDDLIIPYSQVEAKSDPDFAGGHLAHRILSWHNGQHAANGRRPLANAPRYLRETSCTGLTSIPKPRMVGWTAVIFALQTWLAETPETKSAASTPGIFTVGMSFMSLLVQRPSRCDALDADVNKSYLPLFLPPPPVRAGAGSGTEAPAAAPPAQ